MNQCELSKLLASALAGEEKAQARLTSLIIRGDRSQWVNIIKAVSVSTLEAYELAKLPDYIGNTECMGVKPYIEIVKSETVQKRIAKKFKEFIYSLT